MYTDNSATFQIRKNFIRLNKAWDNIQKSQHFQNLTLFPSVTFVVPSYWQMMWSKVSLLRYVLVTPFDMCM